VETISSSWAGQKLAGLIPRAKTWGSSFFTYFESSKDDVNENNVSAGANHENSTSVTSSTDNAPSQYACEYDYSGNDHSNYTTISSDCIADNSSEYYYNPMCYCPGATGENVDYHAIPSQPSVINLSEALPLPLVSDASFFGLPPPPQIDGDTAVAQAVAAAAAAATATTAVTDLSKLDSIGSAGHFEGSCKPCAFFTTKGCMSGSACPFCHICRPGEKKRRQKEKRMYFKCIRQHSRISTSSTVASANDVVV